MLQKSILLGSVLAVSLMTYSFATTGPIETTPVQSNVQVEEEDSITQQLRMLESGIVPTSPEETIELWAKGVKMRNGALQYALFTEDSRVGMKKSMEEFNWVTGASSPWVEGYKIMKLEDGKYQVEFDLATSTGKFGPDQAVLSVVQQGDQWFIQSLGPATEKSAGIWNTPDSINEQ